MLNIVVYVRLFRFYLSFFPSMLHVGYFRIIDVVFIYRFSCKLHIVVNVAFLYRFSCMLHIVVDIVFLYRLSCMFSCILS